MKLSYQVFRFEHAGVEGFVVGYGAKHRWAKVFVTIHGRQYPLAYALHERALSVAKALRRRKWIDVTNQLLTVPLP